MKTTLLIMCVLLLIVLNAILLKNSGKLKATIRNQNESIQLLRIITDELYTPNYVEGMQYMFLLTENDAAYTDVLSSCQKHGLNCSSMMYENVYITLIYALDKSADIASFQSEFNDILKHLPCYVASPFKNTLQHMNRTFREVKIEYETSRFKQETPRVTIRSNEGDEQNPLSKEPKELERRLFLKLINGDYMGGAESLRSILALDHSDYRDLPLLKSKLFCILENAAYLLAFKSGREDTLSDKVPKLWGYFELSRNATELEDRGIHFINMMREEFSPSARQNDMHLADIEAYMKTNFSDSELTISGISASFSILPQQLSRDFKAKYKISPSDFLQQLRLERAKELLVSTEYSNETIAELVGFGSVKALYRAINKVDNTTPNQYRKSAGVLADD